ncbi:PAS domain-containing sensor histidine kinase [Spirosoma fluviale]|uniref:histidine kinase n=1 Tax=Spirosoma fluviale TaxID=1597977 RepID=A0A286F4Z6_9BACT|nr:PAS domain-containing protein [Spirosoma fluviale]SOD78288.1 PAS domain S-box-containing protein [Spirosoma fluviale]
MNRPFAAPSTSLLANEEALLLRSYDQLQTALSIGLIATWFWDLGADNVVGDQNLLRMFGIPESPERIGLTLRVFTDSIHPDDRPRVIQLIDQGIKSGHPYEAEYRIVVNNQIRWVLARGRLTYDNHQKPLAFSGVLVDVTDRKDVELRSQIAETSFRLSVEAARMGTWDYSPLTDQLVWSDRTKELFGLPPTATIDYNVFLQGLHPDDRERTHQMVQAVLQPGNSGRFDCEYRTLGIGDKQLRWIRANGQAFFDEQGTVNRFIGTVIDITADKEAETLLQRRVEEQTHTLEQQALALRTTLDASLNSIIAMTALRDETGTIVDFMMDTANEAVIKSNFMTPDQIIGRKLLTVFPGNKDNGFFDLYARVVETGRAEQSSQYYRDEFGLEGWFEVSAVKQGNNGVVVTYNNITDRKLAELAAQQQERELKEANAELQRSNENLQQFAHIASHDLQEPLRRIQAFSDILQNQFVDSLSDGERDMVRRIQKSAQRMQMLIKDLLLYSQVSTQRDSFMTIPLDTVLDDVVTDLEMTISEKNATVEVSPLPTVYGSASRLRQLFQNLITNGLKFCQTEIPPLIRIQYRAAQPSELPPALLDEPNQAFWLITVTDNGIGFDERYKDRIFTPFQRLHKTSYSGTGIGLAIAQRVTESHGGTIDVTSQEGKGSTFKVFLPAF